MRVVEDLDLIEKYQMKLKSKFYFGADKKPKPVLAWKSPAGKFPYEVNYLSSQRIWGCYIKNPHKSTRHWNGFGVGEPASGKATTVNLIIAFASVADDRTQGAAFIENSKGEILIGHTGNIYRGKDQFWEKFDGEELTGEYSDGTTGKFALVANLSSDECLREIASFVKQVKAIKAIKKKK